MPDYQIGHLNGCTVAILADGNVLPQQVVTDGKITLDAPYSKVSIGLPYYSDLETLNIEVGQNSGTLQGKKVKIGLVTFRVESTRGGWIGPNENQIYEAFPDLVSEKLAADGLNENLMYTGDLRVPLGGGYEDGGRIFYRQVDPLPVTINAVIPETVAGGAAGE
jgi:hypothetical protein